METTPIRILLIEDNKDFAKLVQVYLQRHEKDLFQVEWKESYTDAMQVLDGELRFDIILMDFFLPGRNGLDIARELLQRKIGIPIVFLTVNKDFDFALDVMKLGVEDYFVKEEIASPVLPKAIINIVEKHRLRKEQVAVEISQQRLKAIHQTLGSVLHDFETPLREMSAEAERLAASSLGKSHPNYINIIAENTRRIIGKLEKLKALKVDRTIKYIKDIDMLDLS